MNIPITFIKMYRQQFFNQFVYYINRHYCINHSLEFITNVDQFINHIDLIVERDQIEECIDTWLFNKYENVNMLFKFIGQRHLRYTEFLFILGIKFRESTHQFIFSQQWNQFKYPILIN